MAKTFDDYMNDPDIIDEPMGLRITHAMRFKVQDDIKDMTPEEQTAYYHEGAKAVFKRMGYIPKYVTAYGEEVQ
jgi:hypothetical protein